MKNMDSAVLTGFFEPRDAESSVNYVIDNIKNLLLSQKLKPGDRLPSEMELAKLLSVSRGSIREAMKILAAFGVIEIKRGDGTYVATESNNKLIFEPLLFSFIITRPNFQELEELRSMLEEYLLFLVIQRQTPEMLETLEKCNEDLKNLKARHDIKDFEKILHYDLRFHYLIAQYAGNRLIERIYLFVLEYFKPYIKRGIEDPVKNVKEAMSPHDEIIEAIRNKDINQVQIAVHNSIDIWEKLAKEKE